ncbi:hypothetical protein L798_14244 [Zootermopsis nevadensis]|uniref:Uncharacterized protein n=1 Tax=Zootermopsis nevadensis TaxID=136037 RepID=A0A067QQ19_ZOONE|nr:hypothetical protein L798_14244 [Zootermopsis nevadensis]
MRIIRAARTCGTTDTRIEAPEYDHPPRHGHLLIPVKISINITEQSL